ncbi:hypothetical protein AB0F81_04515 [Actinoplanes sp. NPDC024001]
MWLFEEGGRLAAFGIALLLGLAGGGLLAASAHFGQNCDIW